MADQPWKNEQVRHWLLSGAVLCGIVAAVAGQHYLNRVQPPFPPPPILNKDRSNAPGLLERAARVSAVAAAFNRASEAARASDHAALAAAMDDLRDLKAGSRAEPLAVAAAQDAVMDAIVLDSKAMSLKGAEASGLKTQSALKYREALRLSPRFKSSDPQLTNALGYFLAERGSTPVDFLFAERLTRRALELWDERVRAKDRDDASLSTVVLDRANTRDSLAWALYRQKRYDEALREQQQAIIEATVASKAVAKSEPVSQELHYHLGEIYRALQRWGEAREEYLRALELKPDDAATLKALKQLPSAGAKQGAPSKPGKKPAPSTVPKLQKPEEAEPPAPMPDEAEPEPEVPIVPQSHPLITMQPPLDQYPLR